MNERRDFLKFMGKTTAVAALSPLIMTEKLHSAEFTEYKAIVYVLLQGGNDAFNMVIPTAFTADPNDAEAVESEAISDGNGYYNYKKVRRTLAIKNVDLSSELITDTEGNLDTTTSNPYSGATIDEKYLSGSYHINKLDEDGVPTNEPMGIGINAVMPEVAHLINTNKLAVIGNVSALVEPTTKQQIEESSVRLPVHLFAHNHQQRVHATGIADNNKTSGWAGRLFKELGPINGLNPIGNNTSFSGYAHVLTGNTTSALSLSLNPRGYKARYRVTDLHTALSETASTNPFERLYGTFIQRAYGLSATLGDVFSNPRAYNTLDSYGGSLFSLPSGDNGNVGFDYSDSIISKFEAIAKVIDYNTNNNTEVKRQIFYIDMGGFDTHGSQVNDHPYLLRGLSIALGKFQLAMEELGLSNQVTTMTVSDFGRSSGSNGDGTDHAWAGHNLIMGGAVKSGFYGDIPDFTLGGVQDFSSRGRIIPTVAVDQQYSTVLKWYGVDNTTLDTIFPNLANFDNTRYGRDMGFMKSV